MAPVNKISSAADNSDKPTPAAPARPLPVALLSVLFIAATAIAGFVVAALAASPL